MTALSAATFSLLFWLNAAQKTLLIDMSDKFNVAMEANAESLEFEQSGARDVKGQILLANTTLFMTTTAAHHRRTFTVQTNIGSEEEEEKEVVEVEV